MRQKTPGSLRQGELQDQVCVSKAQSRSQVKNGEKSENGFGRAELRERATEVWSSPGKDSRVSVV